ncbi:hypothetical protein [Romboutsia sp. 1001713B170207_170306_H8]|uniref:hypothetical protein n=1 Tax=Romboutsia sp. 1001713B170207_170306_H8 TaxID=2787112 RepID=UPI001897B232|nr:hypothetical protein [Romboutsia sp. 1001713B170207_170306_H8]
MRYEVGDKVNFKNLIFVMKAEILEIDNGIDYNYHIEYENYEGEKNKVWVNEEDLVGFQKGTKKYLEQEIDKIFKTYTKEELIEMICK